MSHFQSPWWQVPGTYFTKWTSAQYNQCTATSKFSWPRLYFVIWHWSVFSIYSKLTFSSTFLGSCQHPSLPALCIRVFQPYSADCSTVSLVELPPPLHHNTMLCSNQATWMHFPSFQRRYGSFGLVNKSQNTLVLGFLVRTFVLRFKGSFKNLFSYNCHHICILIIPMCHRVASCKWGMSSLLLRAICCYTNGELSGAVV